MTHKRRLSVEGLVSGACLVEVIERVRAVEGVTRVGISLNRGGGSPLVVHCAPWVEPDELRRAVATAGAFTVAEPAAPTVHPGRGHRVVFAADRFAKGDVR